MNNNKILNSCDDRGSDLFYREVLINASNLHVGGGVQVATSIIEELYNIGLFHYSVALSSKVKENLPKHVDLNQFKAWEEVNVFSWKPVKSNLLKREYHICFTVFGPYYHRVNAEKHICGFAQAWICYPNNEVYQSLPLHIRLMTKLKFMVQAHFFTKYDALVVEGEHVKVALEKLGFSTPIHVVSNCVSTQFVKQIQPPVMGKEAKSEGVFTFGYLGRPYQHKNLHILPSVSKILKEDFSIDHDFMFTLTESEMEVMGFNELDNFYSCGPLTISECANFYNKLDGLVFPSLLECFSASPIEAMAAGVPVFASDRGFVSDYCGNSAFYFNPTDAMDIAKTLFLACSDTSRVNRKVLEAERNFKQLPTAKDRAESLVEIINSY